VLEVGVAGLAAERATGEHLATAAEEITGMYASLDEPLAFLRHDIRFHRAIAAASGNPILASLVEMVSALFYETRRKTAGRAHDLRESAEMHRAIYNALRVRDADRSRQAMNEHLVLAQQRQHLEDAAVTNGDAVASPEAGEAPAAERGPEPPRARAHAFTRDLLAGDLAHQAAPVRARGMAMGTRRSRAV
jgi:GntR family transcriptional regulator, transcriptional repressor for pyruvate dehydrogenase complex